MVRWDTGSGDCGLTWISIHHVTIYTSVRAKPLSAAKASPAPSWQNDDCPFHSEIVVKGADIRINAGLRERDAKTCRSHWSFR